MMLKIIQTSYSSDSQKYIDYFLSQTLPPYPLNIMIETINRCNGKCEFCPANTRDEKRTLKKMSENNFYEIIRQLKEIDWHGKLFMCINNEPFIDKRIIDFSRYAKSELSDIKIVIITNGTLLDEKLFDSLVGVIDQITINDYSENYRFSNNNKSLIKHIKQNYDFFNSMRITFNRRYSKEILATRAGSAPNKPKKDIKVTAPCLYPFTDMIIFPDGKVGMCCNDCYELTNYGNVFEDSILQIWGGEAFQKLRNSLQNGRNHPFCKECDVVDAGEREKEIKQIFFHAMCKNETNNS